MKGLVTVLTDHPDMSREADKPAGNYREVRDRPCSHGTLMNFGLYITTHSLSTAHFLQPLPDYLVPGRRCQGLSLIYADVLTLNREKMCT